MNRAAQPQHAGSDRHEHYRAAPAGLNAKCAERAHKTGTDLPVPLCGTGGSGPASEREILTLMTEALALARQMVPAAPLDDGSITAAERWVEQVRAGIDLRRWMMYVVRNARAALREDQRTRRMLDRQLATVRHQERVDREREKGTHWTRREAGRRSHRPVRVEVDREAWDRFTRSARCRGETVGVALGMLIAEGTDRCALSIGTTTIGGIAGC